MARQDRFKRFIAMVLCALMVVGNFAFVQAAEVYDAPQFELGDIPFEMEEVFDLDDLFGGLFDIEELLQLEEFLMDEDPELLLFSDEIEPMSGASINFARLLQLSLFAFDANMCGQYVSTRSRFTWRGNCHLQDNNRPIPTRFQPTGRTQTTVDVRGGFHDAGDHIKFNLPITFGLSTLALAVHLYEDEFRHANALCHAVGLLDHHADFVRRSTVRNANGTVASFVYQVGDGAGGGGRGAAYNDHAFWGPPEVQTAGSSHSGRNRYVYFTDLSAQFPGSEQVAIAAAFLAANYVISGNPADLNYATALFNWVTSETPRLARLGVAGTAYGGNGTRDFYRALRYSDKIALAGEWMVRATGNTTHRRSGTVPNINWPLSWDNHWPKVLLLRGDTASLNTLSTHYFTGTGGAVVRHGTPNVYQVWSNWGNARLNTAMQGVALAYANIRGNTTNANSFANWSYQQMRFLLGGGANTQRNSFVMGYPSIGGTPTIAQTAFQIHHRASHTRPNWSASNPWRDYNARTSNYHFLTGALIGGPGNQSNNATGTFRNDIDDYYHTEVTIDYNASLVLAAAGFMRRFPGDNPVNTNTFPGSFRTVTCSGCIGCTGVTPTTTITYRWSPTMTGGDRNITADPATGHIFRLAELEITDCMVAANRDATLTVQFIADGNNSTRRLIAWTNRSGGSAFSMAFPTAAQLTAGNVIRSDVIAAGAQTVSITIPRNLLHGTTSRATRLYIALTTNNENKIDATNHRGAAEIPGRFQHVTLTVTANEAATNPTVCTAGCNNLPCRCVTGQQPTTRTVTISGGGTGAIVAPTSALPGATVTLNAGTRTGGYTFANWTASSGTFANANNATTTFTIPPGTGGITVTANWNPPQIGGDEFFNLRAWLVANPAATFPDLATDLPDGLGIQFTYQSPASATVVRTGPNQPPFLSLTNRADTDCGFDILGLLPGDRIEVIAKQPDNLVAPAVPTTGGSWGPRFDMWFFTPAWATIAPNREAFTGHLRLHDAGLHAYLDTSAANFSLLPDRVLPAEHPALLWDPMYDTGTRDLVVPAGAVSARIFINRGDWGPPNIDPWAGRVHPNLHIHNIIIHREGGTPPPPPTITAVTAAPATLTNTGGNSTITATGSNLVPANVRIAAFLNNAGTALYTQTPTGSATSVSTALTFPANTGATNRVYTIRVSVNGGTSFLTTPVATVTVNAQAQAPTPVVTAVTAAPATLTNTGGNSTITATGSNLVPANVRIAAFLNNAGTALYTQTPTGSATSVSAALTFPANTGATNRVYTIRVSVNGGTSFLTTPVATVTVNAPPATNPNILGPFDIVFEQAAPGPVWELDMSRLHTDGTQFDNGSIRALGDSRAGSQYRPGVRRQTGANNALSLIPGGFRWTASAGLDLNIETGAAVGGSNTTAARYVGDAFTPIAGRTYRLEMDFTATGRFRIRANHSNFPSGAPPVGYPQLPVPPSAHTAFVGTTETWVLEWTQTANGGDVRINTPGGTGYFIDITRLVIYDITDGPVGASAEISPFAAEFALSGNIPGYVGHGEPPIPVGESRLMPNVILAAGGALPAGYTFTWRHIPGGTIAPGSVVTLTPSGASANISSTQAGTARVEVEVTPAAVVNHAISFNANGGTGTMTPQQSTGANFTMPANGFTPPAHHAFAGWARAATGGTVYTVGQQITNVTAPLTLFARWTRTEWPLANITAPAPRTLTAPAANAPAAIAQLQAAVQTVVIATNPVRDTSATIEWTHLGSPAFNPAPGATNNFRWTAQLPAGVVQVGGMPALFGDVAITNYTPVPGNQPVVFLANGGTGTMAPQQTTGTNFTLPANGFTPPAHHVFAGWARSSSGGTVYAVGHQFTDITAPLSLFARWERTAWPLATLTAPTASALNAPVTTAADVINTLPTSVAITTNPVNAEFTSASITWAVSGAFIATPGAVNNFTWTAQLPSGVVQVGGVPAISATIAVTNYSPGMRAITIIGGGTGSGATPNPAAIDTPVNIDAGVRTGYEFSHWTALPPVAFANATDAITGFTMPDAPVTLIANWRRERDFNNVGSGGEPGAMTVTIRVENILNQMGQLTGAEVHATVTGGPAGQTVDIETQVVFRIRVGNPEIREVTKPVTIPVNIAGGGGGTGFVLVEIDTVNDHARDVLAVPPGTEVSTQGAEYGIVVSGFAVTLNAGIGATFAHSNDAVRALSGYSVMPALPTMLDMVRADGYRLAGWRITGGARDGEWLMEDDQVTADLAATAVWIPRADIDANSPRPFLLGDVDGDGRVTSADATAMARWIQSGIRPDTNFCRYSADITGIGAQANEIPTADDLVMLARWLVGHRVAHLIAQ